MKKQLSRYLAPVKEKFNELLFRLITTPSIIRILWAEQALPKMTTLNEVKSYSEKILIAEEHLDEEGVPSSYAGTFLFLQDFLGLDLNQATELSTYDDTEKEIYNLLVEYLFTFDGATEVNVNRHLGSTETRTTMFTLSWLFSTMHIDIQRICIRRLKAILKNLGTENSTKFKDRITIEEFFQDRITNGGFNFNLKYYAPATKWAEEAAQEFVKNNQGSITTTVDNGGEFSATYTPRRLNTPITPKLGKDFSLTAGFSDEIKNAADDASAIDETVTKLERLDPSIEGELPFDFIMDQEDFNDEPPKKENILSLIDDTEDGAVEDTIEPLVKWMRRFEFRSPNYTKLRKELEDLILEYKFESARKFDVYNDLYDEDHPSELSVCNTQIKDKDPFTKEKFPSYYDLSQAKLALHKDFTKRIDFINSISNKRIVNNTNMIITNRIVLFILFAVLLWLVIDYSIS